jgi:putative transposase
MPNHIHGIIVIVGTSPNPSSVPTHNLDGKTRLGVVSGSLGAVVGSYKSGVTRRIRQTLKDTYLNVWQDSYHDYIIRNEAALNYIRRYVVNTPAL